MRVELEKKQRDNTIYMSTAILFTGKIYPEHLNKCIECSKHTTALKFASIWNNEDTIYIQQLMDNGFIIIRNDTNQQETSKPQFIPIVNGLQYIKEHHSNIEFVLRTRFDILSFDFDRYLEHTQHLYKEKITVISGIFTNIIYFLDIIVCGSIDKMIKLYGLQPTNDTRQPETFLLENYINKKYLTNLETAIEIKNNLHFSLDICIKHNIEFIWIRPNSWKLHTLNIPFMKVINEYCKDTCMWTY